jgi:ribonuclease III
MNRPQETRLIDLLRGPDPDVGRIIHSFVERFNYSYGTPGAVTWDLTKEDWQRYEFLGDRVLNLIVAQSLFTVSNSVMDEGEMTRVLSEAVANRALDALLHRYSPDVFTRLIPASIGRQNTYGERITGGAFEAFIGALYCEFGLDEVTGFVTAVMCGELNGDNPDRNVIGRLQEFYQKRGEALPEYHEISRTGPDHRPVFTVKVVTPGGVSFEGTGTSLSDAKKDAARKALETVPEKGAD